MSPKLTIIDAGMFFIVMLSVIVISVFMQNVVMLSVMAPHLELIKESFSESNFSCKKENSYDGYLPIILKIP